MNSLKQLFAPFSRSLAPKTSLTTKSLTSPISRSISSTLLREDLSSRSSRQLLKVPRFSISTIKALEQGSPTILERLAQGDFRKKAPGTGEGFVDLRREDHQSMVLEAALKGQYTTVHAHPFGTKNSIEPAPLSALLSPVRQYSVLEATRLFPNAPKGEAFGPYVSKLCNAYLNNDASSLGAKERQGLEHLSSTLQSLAVSLKKGYEYLNELQKEIQPGDLGLKQHQALAAMGIIPVNGSGQGYGGPESLGDAALPLFLAVCKAMHGSQHPVALRVELSKDPTDFKGFVDQALKGAQQFSVPVTIINDWSRPDRRTSEEEDAGRIQTNLEHIQELITDQKTQGSKGGNPPLTLLFNASELDQEKPQVKEVYQHFAQEHKPLAFSHNAKPVDQKNPLFERMLETGTVEDPNRLLKDVSDQKMTCEKAIQKAIERVGPLPETWNAD